MATTEDLKEVIISLDVALLAREKGFIQKTRNYDYDTNGARLSLPTQSLLQKWGNDIHV